MYKPPIELFTFDSPIQQVMDQAKKQHEEYIYKCILNAGVNVDKQELLKALQYDRNQYQEGYKDGYLDGLKSFANKVKNTVFRYYDSEIDELLQEMVGD